MMGAALVYGGAAGGLIIGFMIVCFGATDNQGMLTSQFVGYLIMVAALSLTFVGIKRYRDRELGGIIRFREAALLAVLMAVAAGVVYVVAWEIYLAVDGYGFIDAYAAAMLDSARRSGATAAELAALREQMRSLQAGYDQPLIRVGISFLEIFPIALVVALASGAVLSNPRVLPPRPVPGPHGQPGS